MLAANRAKYKNRLQEVATIWDTQPDIMLENFPDVFEGNGGTAKRLPVYTVDAATLERCKSGPPQWIVVSWTGQLNEPVVKHLHDAVLNQFNMEYIYNRYFDPEKVKGVPYTPLRPARAETVATDASARQQDDRGRPERVFLRGLFKHHRSARSPSTGTAPSITPARRASCVELTGLEGHWASVSGFTVTPTADQGPAAARFQRQLRSGGRPRLHVGCERHDVQAVEGGRRQPRGARIFNVRFRPGFGGRGRRSDR